MTHISNSAELAAADLASIQRRTIRVLVAAQIFSGAGLAAGITVGALLAQDMLGSTGLAGVPSALFTFGSAAAAAGVGQLSQRWGRRPGLAVGYSVGSVGSVGVVVAAVVDSVPLLFTAFLIYGAGTATNLQARYAGADLAHPDHRARAVSTVLVATTLGAVIGPNIVGALGDLADSIGIPRLAGPFLLAAVAYGGAGLVIWVLLRPDPLRLAVSNPPGDGQRESGVESQMRSWNPAVIAGASVMVITQLVMVAIMTMTPVYMQHNHHSIDAAGFVIAVHVASMYLPSPISGALVDRYGTATVAVLAAIALVAAGATASVAPPQSITALAVALALLGFGWSLGLIAGTTAITNNTPVATGAKTQGIVDLCIALAGASGGLLSGFVVAGASYATLTTFGSVIAIGIIPIVLLVRYRRR